MGADLLPAKLLRDVIVQWSSGVAGECNVSVSALAYTRDGARLLRRFGFSLLREAALMPDQHDFYVRSAPTPQAFIQTLKARLPCRVSRSTDGAARHE